MFCEWHLSRPLIWAPYGGIYIEQRPQATARLAQELRLLQPVPCVLEGLQHLPDLAGAAGNLSAAWTEDAKSLTA